jgi:hypothetical protein
MGVAGGKRFFSKKSKRGSARGRFGDKWRIYFKGAAGV